MKPEITHFTRESEATKFWETRKAPQGLWIKTNTLEYNKDGTFTVETTFTTQPPWQQS